MIDTHISIEELNKRSGINMARNLGIEFTKLGKDFLTAKMPVDERTTQPMGLINGGASAALAETVGSVAAFLSVDRNKYYTLGLEIKCNHIRGISEGYVHGTAKPVHIGRKTHLWQIEIVDDNNKLICMCSLTMIVVEIDDNLKNKGYKDPYPKRLKD